MTLASQAIEKNVLIDTMVALELPATTFPFREYTLLEGTTDQYKIFWEHVPANVKLPYIVVQHIQGGRMQGTATSQSYSDTIWKIVANTANMAQAEAAANLISLLRNVCPDVSRYTDVTPVTTIQETMPVFDRYLVQNVPQFLVGGLYRLRLNLGAN